MRVRGKRTMKELSLEEYAAFQAKLDDPLNLTSDQLNQVLSMHGFCRLYRAKTEMLEALSSVPLVSPFRSTLALGACPVPLTPDDVAIHVADLDWRECPMVSVSTLRPGPERAGPLSPPPLQQAESSPVKCQSSSSTLWPRLQKLGFPKKRKRTMRVKVTEPELESVTIAAATTTNYILPSVVDDGLNLTL